MVSPKFGRNRLNVSFESSASRKPVKKGFLGVFCVKGLYKGGFW